MNKNIYTINTGVSDSYVHNWNEVSALKEFLQNLVFAKNQLGDATDIRREGDMNVLENVPSGFTKADLLIGQSKQRDIEGSPGYFGEGMILALLIFARNNKKIEIQTNGFKVRPRLEAFEHDPSVKTLVLDVEDIEEEDGTIVMVESSEEDLLEAMSYFLSLQDDKNILKVDTALIIPDTEGVYVNGVRIINDASVYGYNLVDRSLINRDRSAVDRFELEVNISLLLSMEDVTLVQATTIVESILNGDKVIERSSAPSYYKMSGKSATMWRTAMAKAVGVKFDKLCLPGTEKAEREMQYRKMTVLRLNSPDWERFALALGVRSAIDLLEEKPTHTKYVGSSTPEESNNMGRAKRMVKKYYGDYGKVTIVEELEDSVGNRCDGMYLRKEDRILIDSSILDDADRLFITLLHETIHRVSGALDNTAEFTKEWEKAVLGAVHKKPVYSSQDVTALLKERIK